MTESKRVTRDPDAESAASAHRHTDDCYGEIDGRLICATEPPTNAEADAAWEALNRDTAWTWTDLIARHRRRIEAAIRAESSLDVERLDIRWLLDNSNPMHFAGCHGDECSCGVSEKDEDICERQAARESAAEYARLSEAKP